MKLKTNLFALLALATLISFSNAQENQKADAQCEGACPIAKAMEGLPKMSYMVGEEAACCPNAAAALAKKNDLPVHYVVGEAKFDNEKAAFVSLVEQTEKQVKDFLTPCKCEVSGTTTVAGKSCNCPTMAGERAALVKAAADKVHMTYAVGDKECQCPNEASALAKASDQEKFYVVGKEKTCCEMTARLNLARAKYKAAVQAVAAADKTEAKSSGS